jgi:hypothetical protein
LSGVIIDRQGSDVGRWTPQGSRLTGRKWAASLSTYSDALRLTLHAIPAVLRGHGACDVYRTRRADRVVPYLGQDGAAAGSPAHPGAG